MRYKSKIDWWMHLVFASMPIVNIWIIADFVIRGGIVNGVCGIFILLLNIFVIIPMWVNTYYVLDENELLVKCGLGKCTRIAYRSINNVKESRNALSSSALSLDRIEITYGVGGVILISPKEKREFLRQLERRMER